MARHDESLWNSSAAYDLNYIEQTAVPRRRVEPERLPDVKAKTQLQPKEKTKLNIAPFTVMGTAVVIVMLLTVLFSYVRLYEIKSQTNALNNKLVALNKQSAHLKSEYEANLDMDAIEARAKELGLTKPEASQIVYVQVVAGDKTEVYEAPKKVSPFERVVDSFRGIFKEAVDYFS